ncbi:carboxypeptidase Y [Fusarium avenaceum]|nr:carboxypeptidase Y [Fusarium avenaceum]
MQHIVTFLGWFALAIAFPSMQKLLSGSARGGGLASIGADNVGLAPFTVREQGPELCDAGSRHWTGTVNVTDDKSIFFWYFESRDKPSTDPLLLWMSGGPGASGQLGMYLDIGPCTVGPDANSTRRREHSWTDKANVVFVDQPSSVGFSHVNDRDQVPVQLYDGAQDIHSFLATFTSSIFPDLADRPLHITGESMAGHYVTAYTKHIVSRQREARHGSGLPQLNIKSAVIVDGYIDASYQSSGYFDFFCSDWRGDGRDFPLMNATACTIMATAVPECEALGAQCRLTYDEALCSFASSWCEEHVGRFFLDDVKPGGWNPYDSREKCIEPPLCFDLDHGVTERFLNRDWVQERFGFRNVSFQLIDLDVAKRWEAAGHLFLPVTRELTWLLDETDVGVLFLNGNNDIIINTPGQIRMLDELPWHGQAEYRNERFRTWSHKGKQLVEDVASRRMVGAAPAGTYKGGDRLKLVTFDDAGHFAPLHQPEAVGTVVQDWLEMHDG